MQILEELNFSGDIAYIRGDEKHFVVAFNIPATQLQEYNRMQVLYGIDSKITFRAETETGDKIESSFIGKIIASGSMRPEGWKILVGMEREQADGFKGIADMFELPVRVRLEILA